MPQLPECPFEPLDYSSLEAQKERLDQLTYAIEHFIQLKNDEESSLWLGAFSMQIAIDSRTADEVRSQAIANLNRILRSSDMVVFEESGQFWCEMWSLVHTLIEQDMDSAMALYQSIEQLSQSVDPSAVRRWLMEDIIEMFQDAQ